MYNDIYIYTIYTVLYYAYNVVTSLLDLIAIARWRSSQFFGTSLASQAEEHRGAIDLVAIPLQADGTSGYVPGPEGLKNWGRLEMSV